MLEYVFGALVSGLAISDIVEYQMNNQDVVLEPPVDSVSIIVCALNESRYIEQCVQSLRYQRVINRYPEYFELILVDNGSTDNTIELAKPYVDKVLIAPRGKLNARNIGTLYSNGSIIVCCDADMYYPPYWLNTLLKPLKDSSISAVTGSLIDNDVPYITAPIHRLAHITDRMILNNTRIPGGNSAYWKHLFYLIGMFDTSINQKDIKQMLKEEETNFGSKLSQFGKVVYNINASAIHLGGQRIGCRLGLVNKELCKAQGIGIHRFG